MWGDTEMVKTVYLGGQVCSGAGTDKMQTFTAEATG